MKIKSVLLGATLLIGGALAASAPAAAAPLGAAGSALTHKSASVSGDSLASDLIIQVQGRRGGVGRVGGGPRNFGGGGRGFAGGGRGFRGGGGRGIGTGAAVGLGVAGVLGVLGAAAAADAANNGGYYAAPAPVYGGDCYIAREPVYDDWGNFRGNRRVRVCN